MEQSVRVFDPEFDPRDDAGGGDPDATSPTLRAFHKLLWSKPLPGGTHFTLDDTIDGVYLRHSSQLGDFDLTSDSALPTWTSWKRLKHITSQLPSQERADFVRVSYQMGGMLLFPGTQVDGQRSINQEKGFNPRIVDRLDLTVECIRRFYADETSPLTETLQRYAGFFRLFDNFPGYIRFFLLDDLISDEDGAVKLFLPTTDPWGQPLPEDLAMYLVYRDAAESFVRKRNERMRMWLATSTPTHI